MGLFRKRGANVTIEKPAGVVVPSDITIAEHKLENKENPRSLSFNERVGLATVLPMYRRSYVKNNRAELKAVLTKNYLEPNSPQEQTVHSIVTTRQQQIHNKVSQ